MKKRFIVIGSILALWALLLLPLVIPRDTKAPEPVATPAITNDEFSQTPPETTQQQATPSPVVPPPPPENKPAPIVPNSPKQTAIRETVEDEKIYYALQTANDPGYATSWALQSMNAPTAWNIATGDGSTVVAVIDTGFALSHDDLAASWHENSGETGFTTIGSNCWTGTPANKSTNNCDDDANGYVDDWRGWNFSAGDNNPAAGRTNQTGHAVAHGTEAAGLVGAQGNNSTGIATINWNTKIMPLQALSDDGSGFSSDVAAAIYYAVDNGASVINLSIGGVEYDPITETATNYAYENNVVVIAAAGNCGTGNEDGCESVGAGFIGYPARNPQVIAVGASTQSDARASFGSYGSALDVTAPGSGTISSPTWTAANQTSLYSGALYGTSFASPYVASLASLIKSIRPDSSVEDVTALILGTARKPSSMSGQPYTLQLGHGIIDAAKALTVASSLNVTAELPDLLQAGGAKSEHTYSTNQSFGSGCKTETANTYCTVWMKQESTGYDRYLPYTNSALGAQTGWTWNTSMLGSGTWDIRAAQGDLTTTPYTISNK